MPRRLCIVSATLLVALGGAAVASAAPNRAEQSLIAAVNAARTAHGLQPVRLDPRLERAATIHTQDMLRHDYFAHGAVSARLQVVGARGPVLGENLAWSSGADVNAAAIVRLWLESPEHRANLLRPGFRRIGIGAATGSFLGCADATVVTADFGGA
jgi:uncharacterized protein YkwD